MLGASILIASVTALHQVEQTTQIEPQSWNATRFQHTIRTRHTVAPQSWNKPHRWETTTGKTISNAHQPLLIIHQIKLEHVSPAGNWCCIGSTPYNSNLVKFKRYSNVWWATLEFGAGQDGQVIGSVFNTGDHHRSAFFSVDQLAERQNFNLQLLKPLHSWGSRFWHVVILSLGIQCWTLGIRQEFKWSTQGQLSRRHKVGQIFP